MAIQTIDIKIPEGYEIDGKVSEDLTYDGKVCMVIQLRKKKRKVIAFIQDPEGAWVIIPGNKLALSHDPNMYPPEHRYRREEREETV